MYKSMLEGFKETKACLYHRFGYDYGEKPLKDEKSNKIDLDVLKFLKALIGDTSYSSLKNKEIKQFFENVNIPEYNKFIEAIMIRWEAINLFYCDELSNCVNKLIEAEQKAIELELPNWFINDILLDIRNLSEVFVLPIEEKAREAQKKLNNSVEIVQYPVIDRYSVNFRETITKRYEKNMVKSPYTVTFGDDITSLIENIFDIFITAFYYGSLTHLRITNNRIKELLFCMNTKYKDSIYFKNYLKAAIITLSEEKEAIRDLFSSHFSIITNEDAEEIWKTANNISIEKYCFRGEIIALNFIGNFMDDNVFRDAEETIIKQINDCSVGDEKFWQLDEYLINFIRKCSIRLDANKWIPMIIKLEEEKKAFDNGNNVQALLNIGYKNVNKETSQILLNWIYKNINEETFNDANFQNLILGFRTDAVGVDFQELDKTIAEKQLKFNEIWYLRNILPETEINYNEIIETFISDIEKIEFNSNKISGNDGVELIDLKRVIEDCSISQISDETVNKLIDLVRNILDKKYHMNIKAYAIDVFLVLVCKFERSIENKEMLFRMLEYTEKEVDDRTSFIFMISRSANSLNFNICIIKYILNMIKMEEMFSQLAFVAYGEKKDIIEALKSIGIIVKYWPNKNKENLVCFFQFILSNIYSEVSDIRHFAMKALVDLTDVYGEISYKHLFDLYDNANEVNKTHLLSSLFKKGISNRYVDEIIKKAFEDNNFIVRKVANQFIELTDSEKKND